MGRRDFRHHEAKKVKKDAKKVIAPTSVEAPPPVPELVRPKRKERWEEEPK